jgi:hypothetical protein
VVGGGPVQRQVKAPKLSWADRAVLAVLARHLHQPLERHQPEFGGLRFDN